MRFAATVVEKSADAGDPWIACDVAGKNQDDVTIVAAHGVVTLPMRRADDGPRGRRALDVIDLVKAVSGSAVRPRSPRSTA